MNVFVENVPLLIIGGAIGLPIALYMILWLGEKIVASLPAAAARRSQPWVWLFTPIVLVTLIHVYPLVQTIFTSFLNADGTRSVGFENYVWAFQGRMITVLKNNLVWLFVFPLATLVLALLAATFFDKVRYERLAMTLVILPTAISFTAGSVIWIQMYLYRPAGEVQLGTLNALWTLIPGTRPIPWLQTPGINNLALILIAVWLLLGIATLILSSAIKNVPTELIEAARLDGAGEFRIFRSVILPMILPSVLVVLTTMLILSLKIFDIVYIMTNGNYRTDVIANRLFDELFSSSDLGHASAIAVLLLIAALPVVFINIFQFREDRS